ncbi:error-prone DNA polymerase [Chitinivorax tropicus]|uniref:error-prone DNA polymerase n=1 Tax=Chitinivorax tropicus TaxID=714531 RepID=UPI00161B3613|nr:error-prone DNA polymerase [Chitinivorax tropicus]
MPDYAELHCLTNFTFQQGASHAEELVKRAVELGYRALAITDECSLAGIVRAHVAAKAHQLQLIIGTRLVLADGTRLILLAPDGHAYADLSSLISHGRRQAAKGTYHLTRDDITRHSPHLLALWLPPTPPTPDDAAWLQHTFPDRCWLAAEQLYHPGDQARLHQLSQLSRQTGLRLVATGGVVMHVRARLMLQHTLTAISLGKPIAQCGQHLQANSERHLRPRQHLADLYPPALLAETIRIAERCHFSLDELHYAYPVEMVPPGLDGIAYLRKLVNSGLQQRFPAGTNASVVAQAEKELALIEELGYENYFLTVHDIVSWARGQHILCQGRGSAANSVVCYALHITEVSPTLTQLLFERFLSRERNEPPDIDVDFEHERREEVMQYIYRRYGREHAALTATVITYRKRSAFRDVGRALGYEEAQLDRLSASLAWWDEPSAWQARLQEAGFDPAAKQVQSLLKLTRELIGFPRHLSQHVGGFVISRSSLSQLVPIENAAMADRTVIQWDKDDLDAMGMLKVDILALGMLSAIRRALDSVSRIRGQPFTLADIPPEDPAVYAMLQRADTIGVFQIESRAQMSMLPRLKPRHFYDLVIEVALVRPGPIQGGMVHPYLKARQSPHTVTYPSKDLESILKRTLGIPIFQEQVMQIAVVAAGFTPGEADHLRRSMAAWRRTGKLEQFRDRLRTGMLARGYSETFAEQIFRQIEGFSEYGFPESHAVSFALLVYSSAWLKCHAPAAFCCALLNSQPMGFYSPSQLIQDARRHQVTVLPVDLQHSEWDCSLEDMGDGQHSVRLGFSMVHGLSESTGRRLSTARPASGYPDIESARQLAALTRQDMGALANANAFSAFTDNRREAWWAVLGQDTRHDLAIGTISPEATPGLPALSVADAIQADYASLGLTLGPHPLSLLRPRLTQQRLLSATAISQMPNGRLARCAGLVISRQRPGTASGVVFVTLEDETGNTNIIVWNELAQTQRKALLAARLLGVYGIIQREGAVVHLLAKRLVDLTDWLDGLPTSSRDFR